MRHIIFRALCLTVFAFAAVTLNAREITIGKIKYNTNTTENTATVIGADDDLEGEVSIPTHIIDGTSYIVTEIGEFAFAGKAITKITLPTTISTIGTSAFANCSKLTSIVIPNSVETIGQDAFSNCSSLKSVTLPSSAKEWCDLFTTTTRDKIQELAYAEGCTTIFPTFFYNVTSVILPSTATTIEADAFNNFKNLVSVDIPASVTTIGERAFDESGLTSISIPNSVTSIGDNAFEESKLTSITIPASVTQIGDYAFFGCKELKTVEILGPVSTIESGTFSNCPSLKSISIPESVTSIKSGTFGLADGTNFICFAATPPALETNDALSNVSNANLYVKKASLELYKSTPTWKDFMQIYAYEDGVACAVPDVAFVNGKIVVTCATPGAKCVRLDWKLTGSSTAVNSEITPTRILSVKAEVAAEGYQNTITEKTLILTDVNPTPGDINGDGKFTVGDITKLVDKLQGE